MAYPSEYITFLIHFHCDRDYFECHEILEDYWKKSDDFSRSSIWAGLIQIAVSFYHYRRGNFTGAIRLITKARRLFGKKENETALLGLDYPSLLILLDHTLTELQSGQPYKSTALPISDQFLIKTCKERCQKLGLKWNQPSDLNNKQLVDRHILRSRSHSADTSRP